MILANLETFKRSIVLDPSAMPEEEDGGKVNNETEAEIVVRDLVIQAVLMVGSRSFSHFLNVVER